MPKFLHKDDDDAKAIAIPWVFTKNSRAKNDIGGKGEIACFEQFLLFSQYSHKSF